MHRITLWITAMLAVTTLLFAYHLNLAGTSGKAAPNPACATATATATTGATATADPDCAATAKPGENK
jgi:hypothetical protein